MSIDTYGIEQDDRFAALVHSVANGTEMVDVAKDLGLSVKQCRDILDSPFMKARIAQEKAKLGALAEEKPDKILELGAPLAARRIIELASQERNPRLALDASRTILDRAGIVSKERSGVPTLVPIFIPAEQAKNLALAMQESLGLPSGEEQLEMIDVEVEVVEVESVNG